MQRPSIGLVPLALAALLSAAGTSPGRVACAEEPGVPRPDQPAVVARVAAAATSDAGALMVAEELMTAGYPLVWVVEEIVFHYGDRQLPELVWLVRFLYGQAAKDLVRDAVRRGALRRFVERERMCRALRASGGQTRIAGRSVEEAQAICAWDNVDWNIVSFGERATDLHFLLYQDDPGAYVSAQ